MAISHIYVPVQETTTYQLIALRQCEDEALSDVIGRLIDMPSSPTNSKSAPQSNSNNSCRQTRLKYRLHILGENISANTCPKILVKCLNLLADLDPAILEKILPLKGRTRHYIAKTRKIHKGRPDLDQRNTCEFRPGWFTGTNYGRDDVERMLAGICSIIELDYGVDIYFSSRKKY